MCGLLGFPSGKPWTGSNLLASVPNLEITMRSLIAAPITRYKPITALHGLLQGNASTQRLGRRVGSARERCPRARHLSTALLSVGRLKGLEGRMNPTGKLSKVLLQVAFALYSSRL